MTTKPLVMIGGHQKLSKYVPTTTIDDVRVMPVALKKGDATHPGTLFAVESLKNLPFSMRRVFTVIHTPVGKVRGNHAHRQCQQALLCIQGNCLVVYDDGKNKNEVVLSAPDSLLYLPAGIWASQTYLTNDTILMVFADQLYDEADYVRDYNEFLLFRGLTP